MRKLGVRVVSAALAACMMASVLPVSAFAAGGEDAGAAYSVTAPEGTAELPVLTGSKDLTTGGTYKLTADRTERFVIDTSENVTIYIASNVKSVPSLDIKNVGVLMIVNETGMAVTSDYTFLTVRDTASANAKVTVSGGSYQCSSGTAFNFCAGSAELNDVSVESSDIAVANNGSGTVTIAGGSYKSTGTGENDVTLLNNSTGTLVVKGSPQVSGAKTAVINKAGKVTLEGGSYTSENGITVSNINAAGIMEIIGGTFQRTSGDGRVVQNNGTMTIGAVGGTDSAVSIKSEDAAAGAVINSGMLTFNAGTVTGGKGGSGITTVSDGTAETTINGGTITGCNSGIVMQDGTITVTVNKVTLTDNNHDITLGKGEKITFGSNYTGSPSIRVFDPADGRQLTTDGAPAGLTLIPHNSGYVVEERGSAYYLKRNDLHTLTVKKASAQADDGSEDLTDLTSPAEVPEGTKVYLQADAAPGGERFARWEVSTTAPEGLTLANKAEVDFTMPKGDVTVTAVYEPIPPEPVNPAEPVEPVNPGSTGDDGMGTVIAVVGTGALIWGGYELGTELYRVYQMQGVAVLPSNRAELAELIWEKAEKPEPESDVLFEDIDKDDTDLQKAARWMVEQDLLREKEEGKFAPYGFVTKLHACATWNEAREKGLID